MKLNSALVALMATLVASHAYAVPSPDPHKTMGGHQVGFCGAPGTACLKVKRAANAIANALAEADAHKTMGGHQVGFCGAPGTACLKAREAIEDIAHEAGEATRSIAEREAAAEAEAHKTMGGHQVGFCGAPGTACLKARDADELQCGAPGSPCTAYREANPKHADGHKLGFCGGPGTPCVATRDAKKPMGGHQVGFCGAPGTACLKARDAKKTMGGHQVGFCGAPGTACLKARDAEKVASIINENDPNHFKNECFKEGRECNTILKVAKAFKAAKRAVEEEAKETDINKKMAYCGEEGSECGPLTHDYAEAAKQGAPSAKQAEKDCSGPNGACTVANSDFDKLERTIDNAVNSLYAL